MRKTLDFYMGWHGPTLTYALTGAWILIITLVTLFNCWSYIFLLAGFLSSIVLYRFVRHGQKKLDNLTSANKLGKILGA